MNQQRELWEAVKSEYLKQIEEALKALDQPNTLELLDDVAAHLQRKYRDLTLEERCLEKFEKIITQMGPASEYVELLKTSGGKTSARPPLPPENGRSHPGPIDKPDKASAEKPTAKRVGVPVFIPVDSPYDDQAVLRKVKLLGWGLVVTIGIIILIIVVIPQLKRHRIGFEIIGFDSQPAPTAAPQTAAPVAPTRQTTDDSGTNNSLDLDLQTYIISFTTASDVNAITAKELLAMFSAEQPPKTKTHHYKTDLRENKLVGLICVDGKSDLDATTQMLLRSNDLKLVSMEPATEDSLKKLYAMGQPSLTAKLPVPSAPAAENTNNVVPLAPIMPPAENTNTANTIQKGQLQQPHQSIVFLANPAAKGIAVGNVHCTAGVIRSILGTPTRIELNRRMLRYTDDGIDFLLSENGQLSEIHLNKGFEGRLDTGISLNSTQQDVFNTYGAPGAKIRVDDLHKQNDERILYLNDNTSRIYYGEFGLIFWFRDNRIIQIVVFKSK